MPRGVATFSPAERSGGAAVDLRRPYRFLDPVDRADVAEQVLVGLAFLLAIGAQPVARAAGVNVVDEQEGHVGRRERAGLAAAEHGHTRHAGQNAAAGEVQPVGAPTRSRRIICSRQTIDRVASRTLSICTCERSSHTVTLPLRIEGGRRNLSGCVGAPWDSILACSPVA